MKRRLCPQCKIPNFYLLNEKGERRLVFVTDDFRIVPSRPVETREGLDTTVIYWLGCNRRGSPRKAVRDLDNDHGQRESVIKTVNNVKP